jgi:hypothetical protein
LFILLLFEGEEEEEDERGLLFSIPSPPPPPPPPLVVVVGGGGGVCDDDEEGVEARFMACVDGRWLRRERRRKKDQTPHRREGVCVCVCGERWVCLLLLGPLPLLFEGMFFSGGAGGGGGLFVCVCVYVFRY